MIKHIFLCLFLSVGMTGLLPTASFSQSNYIKREVTPDSLDVLLAEIEDYYIAQFEAGSGVIPVSQALDEINQLMSSLFDVAPVEEHCTAGAMTNMSVSYSLNNSSGIDLNVGWDENGTAEGYFGVFLDFNMNRPVISDYAAGRESEISLELPDHIHNKFYAFNGRCIDSQDAYFIIIVEKDLDLSAIFPGDETGGGHQDIPDDPVPPGGGAMITNISPGANLLVFPNPVQGQETSIEFDLPIAQVTSLYVMEGNSGKIIQSLLSEQKMEEGYHQESIDLLPLANGIYYVVLQTNQERIVRKLVKL